VKWVTPNALVLTASPTHVLAASELAAASLLAHPLSASLVPRVSARLPALTSVLTVLIAHALEHGHVDVLIAPARSTIPLPKQRKAPLAAPTQTCTVRGSLAGVAVWSSSSGPPIPDIGRRLERAAGRDAVPFARYLSASDVHHPASFGMPGAIHHHLNLLAIHPAHQRAGHAGALMRAHHRLLDDRGTPAYVEVPGDLHQFFAQHGYRGDPRTIPFDAAGRPGLRPAPRSAATLTPMWRPPDSSPRHRERPP
jgi:GNAT superfamily N-acetyltransferase